MTVARFTLRPDDPDANREEVEVWSDVWPTRPSLTPEPSPVAFALHDAKNMMCVLLANLEVLGRSLGDTPLPEGAPEALADISESAERLSGLLREALNDLQGNRLQRAAPSALRVAPIVAAAVERMRPAARARGVHIVQTTTDDARATIEPELLERVMANLLENAVRFSRAGDTVEVQCSMQGERMTLAVCDRGPGVPESARDEIFESYRRRESNAAASHFGLGLAFCREVARAHGGNAWVFNRAGGGACFVFETD
jgi:two-component system sensor histidine kinase CreC